MKFFPGSDRFAVQLLLAFTLFTIGTTLALGAPVTFLLERQADFQARSLLEQAGQTSAALLENKSTQLQNLALLIAERPTLNQLLLDGGNSPTLHNYLADILESTAIEALLICRGQDAVGSAGVETDPGLCQSATREGFTLRDHEVWLISAANLADTQSRDTRVLLGQRAASVLREFNAQTGLAYALVSDDQLLVAGGPGAGDPGLASALASLEQDQTLLLQNDSSSGAAYMAGIQTIPGNPDLELVSLLNVEEYLASSRQLRNLILATLAAVSLLGAIVAVLVSRRISQPLSRLAQAAAALRGGDLKTPLAVPSRVWEVNQLTNALEDARVSLKHSLEQLHKEKAWIENLLNSIVEGLLTLNEHARVTFASEGIERITGLNSDLMLGRPVDDFFITPADEEDFSGQLPAPNQSRRVAVTVNGHAALLAVSASEFIPPEAGNASRALLIRDVSDEERIHRLMGDFMANITHEFRTPLSALAASVELLLEQLPDLSPQEIEDLLHSFNVGIISLQSLIDNLLEAASIETGRFKVVPHPVELNTIIAEAVATVQPISAKYGLSIKSPKNKRSLRVLADKRRTAQAMVNLLSNAIKHSPEGGVIEVIPVIVDRQAVIEVTDQGVGIPQDQRQHLFHRFAALADDSESVQPGFGLGLSVVKAIIEAQHGQVGFSEQAGGGSRFWFSLPLADEEAA